MASNNNTIYNFKPDYIGALVAQAKWEECWDYMADVIQNLTMNAGNSAQAFSFQLQRDLQDEDKKNYVHQFGSLLGELFLFLLTTPEVGMSDKSFERLIHYHETLHTLFYIFEMDDTDELVEKALTSKSLPPKEQKKLLLLLSMNTKLDLNKILKSLEPSLSSPAIVNYLGHRKIFRENIYNNKVRLHEMGRSLHRAYKPSQTFANLVHAYFLTSYLDMPDRHKLKEDMNIAARQFINSIAKDFKKLKALPRKDYGFETDDTKPVILVIHEYYKANHAMTRGWGRLIKSLESEFHVLNAAPSDGAKYQQKNLAYFTKMSDFYELVLAANADIIFMPSVGMRIYNIVFSNMRNAPIQIAGLGHPATTMSEFIDYVVSPGGLYTAEAFPKDTYIADGYPEKHTPLLSKEDFFAPLPEDEIPAREIDGRKILRVCVVGTDIKVSYPFFNFLKTLIAESPYEIHISFMLGVGGIDSLYIEKYLKENFENCTYYGWQAYTDYIKNLKKMDIVLNPFPFGHTNTIIDTLMCGKPCVGLKGTEPSALTEKDVLHAVGLDHLFVAENLEDYKQKFFGLSDKIMKGETEFFDRNAVYDRIFAELGDYDYGKVFKWIYDNNAALKSSGKKYHDVFEAIES